MALQIGTLDFPVLFLALGFWLALYFLMCAVDPRHSYEWHCRIVTGIHGVLITSMAAWCAFVQGPWPFTDAGGPNTPLQWLTVIVCLGYFIFDFSWCLYFKAEGAVMMVHHCLSIIGLSMCLVFNRWGTELVATICGGEMTNPLLQLRWFLKETGNYDTWCGELNDFVFMFLFGFIRVGVGSALLHSYFQQPTDYVGRFGGVCIYTIGWLFFINIVQFGINKYKKKWLAYKARQKRILNLTGKTNGECSSNGDCSSQWEGDSLQTTDKHLSIKDNDSMTKDDTAKKTDSCIKDETTKDNNFVTNNEEQQVTSFGMGDGDKAISVSHQSCFESGEHIKKLVSGLLNEIPSADACLRRVVNPGGEHANHLINDLVISGHVSCMCSETEDKKIL